MAAHMVRWIKNGKDLPARKFSHLRLVPNSTKIKSVIEIDLDGPSGTRIQAMRFDAYQSRRLD
jgi:hypothetical protein